MVNVGRELAVHMSHPGTEHWEALGRLIGYIKCIETKGIIIKYPKVMKAVMFYDLNYDTEIKEAPRSELP